MIRPLAEVRPQRIDQQMRPPGLNAPQPSHQPARILVVALAIFAVTPPLAGCAGGSRSPPRTSPPGARAAHTSARPEAHSAPSSTPIVPGVRPARKPAPAGAIAAASKRSQRFRQVLLAYAACLHNNGAGTPPPDTSGRG